MHPVVFMCNLTIMLLAALPSMLYTIFLQQTCDASMPALTATWPPLDTCQIFLHHPIIYVNILFFLNVCVLFWLLSLIQQSTWLIDPYWTLIPPLIAAYYHFHPLAVHPKDERSVACFVLVVLWATRLTHSYFRREGWMIGKREDWRFTDMRRQYKGHWWWISLFVVYVAQQPMLVGLTLPLYAVNFPRIPSNSFADVLAAFVACGGIAIAATADTQLYHYMQDKERGKCTDIVLRTGLWKYSRHPNYFGEQLWWWTLAIFGCLAGHSWTTVGTLFNSAIMWHVTSLTEARMLQNKARAKEYQAYCDATSAWLPWWPKQKKHIE